LVEISPFFFFLFLDFPVTTPPRLTREQYEDYLDEKSIKQDYLAFLDSKPVLTTGGISFVLSCLLQINFLDLFIFYLIFYFNLESLLAIAMKAPCSIFAATIPEVFTAITEVTSLSLPCSNLTALPESLGLLFCYSFFYFLPLFIILPLFSFINRPGRT